MKTLLKLLLFTGIIYVNEIKSQALPDLWINNIKSNSQQVQPGHTIDVGYTLHNSGTVNSPYSYSAYYLSTDSIKDTGDLLLGYDYETPIKAGDSIYYNYYNFSIPYSTVYGNYYILFVSDFNTMIPEQSEINNVSTFAVTIGPVNADLVAQPVTTSPSVMVPGQSKTVPFEIRNNGISSVMADYLCVLSDDTIWSPDDVEIKSGAYYNSLAQNSSAVFNIPIAIPANTTPGSYYLLYIADYTNSVNETDETNNLKHYPLSVVLQNADLDIISENVRPSTISSGGNCMVSFDLTNLGTTDVARGVTEVFFCISKDTVYDGSDYVFYYPYSGSYTNILLNDSNTVHYNAYKNIPASLAPGNYYILIIAESRNLITETNNANNTGYYPITITPAGTTSQFNDVAVLSGNVTGTVFASGREIVLTSKIYIPNNPTGAYNYLRYILSADTIVDNNDITIGNDYVYHSSSDTVFKTFKIRLPQDLSAGQYYVIFDMDTIAGDTIPQNNRKFQALTILDPDYDLALNPNEISSVTFSPGNKFTLSLDVYNHGIGKPGSFQMAFYLSDDSILDTTDLQLIDAYSYPNYFYSWVKEDTLETTANGGIPENTSYGNKYILCQIDYANTIPEINENNNVCFFSVSIVQPNMDLSFFSPFPVTSNVDYSNYINWDENIINLGSTSSTPTYVSYYKSNDTVLDNTDEYLSSSPVFAINAYGNLNTIHRQWISNLFFYGDFYIISYLDKYNNLAETNENNNISFIKFQQPLTPDIELSLNSAMLNKNADVLGATVHLTCKLQNDGTTRSGDIMTGIYFSTDSIYSSNDILRETDDKSNIYPSESAVSSFNFYFPYNTMPGNYFILVIADPQNLIAESNENNNQLTIAYTILPQTLDYSINSPLVIPADITTGTSAFICYNFEKSGNGIGNYYYNQVTFILSSDTLQSSDDLNLGYGSPYQSSVIIPSTVTSGNYYILFIVDFGNTTVETNENNNIAWFPVSIQQLPVDIDLVIGSATAPEIANAGDRILITYSVNNMGTTPVYTAIETGFYLSTDSIWGEADVFLPLIPPSYYQTPTYLQIPEQIAPGNYYILFFADYKSKYGETNEFNNTKAIPITISLLDIDLTIQQPVILPDTLVTNSITDISFVIKNTGSTTSPAFISSCYLSRDSVYSYSDIEIRRTNTVSINANDSLVQSTSFYLDVDIAPGAYYLLIVSDQYTDYNGTLRNDVVESNENNNTLALPIIIKRADIDLTFQELQTPITTAIAGASFPLSFKTANLGSDLSCQVYMGTYLSKDSILTQSDTYLGGQYIYPLDGYSSRNETGYLNLPATCSGSYYIILRADRTNTCPETNEDNNIAWYPITVVSPTEDSTLTNVDIAILSAGTVASVALGSQFTVGSTVHNLGMSTATGVRIEYYLSTDSILSSSDLYFYNNSYINSIIPNGVQTINQQLYTYNLTDTGNFYLILKVDCNSAYDKNWTNNFKAIPIRVVRPSNQITDLSITGHLINPGIIYPGSVAGFSSKINNLALDSAKYISNYYLSKDSILDNNRGTWLTQDYQSSIHGLDSINTTMSLHFPFTVEPGNYYIIANVRSNYPVIDRDSSNNMQFIPITISASDNDLSIPSIVLSVDTIHNDTATIFTIVLNGGLSTSYFTRMAYYLSGDASLSSDDVYLKDISLKTIFSMDDTIIQQSVVLPAYIVNGNYYLLNYADHLNQVVETNEFNNINSVKVNIIRTGIQTNEENFNFLIIYPNPTTGKFTIKLDTDKKNSGEIFIYNELGLLVKKESIINQTGDVSIDLKNLTKGIYMVQYISDDGIFTSKVLLQ